MAGGTPQSGEDRRLTEREIGEFLLRTCHDLRTAVRAILAHSELLLKSGETPLPADIGERLEFIAGGAKKLDSVVDSLSGYSLALQIEAADFTPVPLEPLLRTALAKLSRELREAEAEVTYDQLPRVPGNADRLLKLWENLLRYSLRRGNGPVRLHVGAEQQAAEWVFSIGPDSPRGGGATTEKYVPELAVSRAIVAGHGGRMWTEPQNHASVRIFFSLPAQGPD